MRTGVPETTQELGDSPRGLALLAVAALVLAVGCPAEPEPTRAIPSTSTTSAPGAAGPARAAAPTLAAEPTDPAMLAEQGRGYYLSSCTACHNADPSKDGALGPAVLGSSYALIEARVMKAEYPAGYTPKRETRVMVAMPFLEKQLPALAAYLD